MIRVLIVDDDEIVLEGLVRNIPWEENQCLVVGTAGDGEAGFRLAKELHPDVVLTDICMPMLDGIGLSELVAKELPGTKVVVLSAHDDFAYAKKALMARVSAYVLKYEDNKEVLAAILEAAREGMRERELNDAGRKVRDLETASLLRRLLAGAGSSESGSVGIEHSDPSLGNSLFVIALASRLQGELHPDNGDWAGLLNEPSLKMKQAHFFLELEGESVLAFPLPLQCDPEPVREYLKALLVLARRKFGVDSRILMEPVCCTAGELRNCWTGLKKALTLLRSGNRTGLIEASEHIGMEYSSTALFLRMKEQVDREFRDESLSLADLAATANVVKTYASTLFKRHQGMGFAEYLVKVRMEAAMLLLSDTDLPTADIAVRVGIPNPQYFSMAFRKFAGCTPSQFRRDGKAVPKR